MGFGKKLAGMFVEMPEDKEPPKKEKPTSIVTLPGASPVFNNPVTVDNQTVKQWSDHFDKILADENQRNFPGSDYYEFMVMKNAMVGVVDEVVKYNAAFAGLSATGMTKDKLTSTAQQYIAVIDGEVGQFEQAYQIRYDQKVTQPNSLVDQKSKEMAQLSERIKVLSDEMRQLQDGVRESQVKLSSDKQAFESAANSKKQDIQAEIGKINSLIN